MKRNVRQAGTGICGQIEIEKFKKGLSYIFFNINGEEVVRKEREARRGKCEDVYMFMYRSNHEFEK